VEETLRPAWRVPLHGWLDAVLLELIRHQVIDFSSQSLFAKGILTNLRLGVVC
jgi:hypothetical protein